MEIDWTAVGAIATSIATIVALGIAIYNNLQQRKIALKVSLSTKGRYSSEKNSILVISNIGNLPITITRMKLLYKNNEKVEVPDQKDLPRTLSAQENFHLNCPAIAYNIDKIAEILLEDIIGKDWVCEKKSILQAKEIYKNFIGNRIRFSDMGDITDENKLQD